MPRKTYLDRMEAIRDLKLDIEHQEREVRSKSTAASSAQRELKKAGEKLMELKRELSELRRG